MHLLTKTFYDWYQYFIYMKYVAIEIHTTYIYPSKEQNKTLWIPKFRNISLPASAPIDRFANINLTKYGLEDICYTEFLTRKLRVAFEIWLLENSGLKIYWICSPKESFCLACKIMCELFLDEYFRSQTVREGND